jgi:hypothetical protein
MVILFFSNCVFVDGSDRVRSAAFFWSTLHAHADELSIIKAHAVAITLIWLGLLENCLSCLDNTWELEGREHITETLAALLHFESKRWLTFIIFPQLQPRGSMKAARMKTRDRGAASNSTCLFLSWVRNSLQFYITAWSAIKRLMRRTPTNKFYARIFPWCITEAWCERNLLILKHQAGWVTLLWAFCCTWNSLWNICYRWEEKL